MSLRCIKKEIINELKNPYFVETGTLSGDGVLYALEMGFSNIISIDTNHYAVINNKFLENKNVSFIQGDSGLCLLNAIENINEKITFWLDAHSDLVPHANWKPICPILEELQQIKHHPIKDHHILIDDITPIIKIPGISKSKIKELILEINQNYKINYVDTGGTQTLIATTNGRDYNDYSPAYD
jgi:hypothetical protein